MQELPPNQTLYVNNLSEKLKREELKKMLYSIFSVHGAILEIIALKTNKMRGQAFVIYKDIQCATAAKRELNNFPFFGRPMRVNYAKDRSHLVEKMEGTFDAEAVKQAKQKRKVDQVDNPSKDTAADGSEVNNSAKKAKTAAVIPQAPQEPPNHILFVQNLPEETTELMVQMLFQQFPGFGSVQLVEGKGIAFVEFSDIPTADVAMKSLQHFKVTDNHLMMISYAKK